MDKVSKRRAAIQRVSFLSNVLNY